MKICAYVMDAYAKQTYTTESHDVRAWPGFEVVLDACRRAGYLIEYAGRATVHEYDVVLVSITSDCDWWPFIAERVTWKLSPLVIVGGAGVLNVRPFLTYCDCFVLGRGEKSLPAILAEHEKSNRFESQSIIWADSFSVSDSYKIMQTPEPYPHEIIMTNGKPFKEGSIGCPNKCLFCGYTWQRKYIGDGSYSAGAESMSGGNRERTIMDLLKEDPSEWQKPGPLRIVGVDGMSERLRMMANKRITRDMFRAFLDGLASIPKPHQVKLYFIVGYPGETEQDWGEFLEDIKTIDAKQKKSEAQWCLLTHFTPFRAMPATPSAVWPMSKRNYRGVIAQHLRKAGMKGNVFFQGNQFWAVEGMGTDGLSTVIHSALCLRGTESDAENIKRVSCAKKYWPASSKDKLNMLEKMFDIDTLFSAFTWDTLPTRYLKTCIKQSTIERMSLNFVKY